MKTIITDRNTFNWVFLTGMFFWILGCGEVEQPNVEKFSPTFGPAETLITVEGMHFETVQYILFDGNVPADFNPSFGTDNALLFRVPLNAELGENTIRIGTEGGEVTFPFRVTRLPPEVQDFSPKSANEGDLVTILGENFFEPLEVLFFDSVPGEIIHAVEDSLVVSVPAGVEKGQIKVKANGGSSLTNEVFFSTTDILVNDFDGNGLRSNTNMWLFYGNIDQNAFNAVQSSDPEPIDGQFLKLSGKDPGSVWIGGAENHSWDVDNFDVFPIMSDIDNTFLEVDFNSNGQDDTYVIIVLVERDGSGNDFTQTIEIDWNNWKRVSIPLNRFKDIDGFTIDPQKIRAVKLHLFNEAGTSQSLEVNVDNLTFVQIN
ncbi:MAG: IPT/TIG domain-containing protein [Bacteroidota bacterium]